MMQSTREQVSRLRRKIKESRGVTEKWLKKIKPKSTFHKLTRLLLKLKLDNQITKFLYKQLNIGSKIEFYTALYHTTEDENVKKDCIEKATKLKRENLRVIADYIVINRLFGQYKLFTRVSETVSKLRDGKFVEREIKPEEHITIEKANRIAYSIDFSRLMILEAMDNLIRPQVTGNPIDSSTTIDFSFPEIDLPDLPIRKGRLGKIGLIAAVGSLGLYAYSKYQEAEEAEAKLEEIKDLIESTDDVPTPGSTVTEGRKSQDLIPKEIPAKPPQVTEDPNPKLDASLISVRRERLKELVKEGLFKSQVLNSHELTHNSHQYSKDTINFIKKIPKLINTESPELMDFLSDPRNPLITIIKDFNIDSPKTIKQQVSQNFKSKMKGMQSHTEKTVSDMKRVIKKNKKIQEKLEKGEEVTKKDVQEALKSEYSQSEVDNYSSVVTESIKTPEMKVIENKETGDPEGKWEPSQTNSKSPDISHTPIKVTKVEEKDEEPQYKSTPQINYYSQVGSNTRIKYVK